MDPATQPFDDKDIRDRLAKSKYEQKWDILKPVIQKFWFEDDRKLSELIKDIEASYRFTAQESQYKYHFKKWKWKRNISTPKKEALCKIRNTRAEAGRATHFEYQGKTVDEKKLRRHMKDTMRKGPAVLTPAGEEVDWKAITGSSFILGDSILLNWRRPFGIRQHSAYLAPSPMSMSTPSDTVVETPPANNAHSPSNVPSPFAQAVQKKKAVNRAYMLVEGQHAALIKSMGGEERETMSTWLYQFWMYAFKTAKYWGRGPRNWTADLLRFETFKAAGLMHPPRSPVTNFEAVPHQQFHSVMLQGARRNVDDISLTARPSPLCRWSIHYRNQIEYQPCKARTPSPEPDVDSLDEASWRPWPSSQFIPSIRQTLTQGIESNHFSDIATENLPIALDKLAQALESTSENFVEETLGFSIMGRNSDMAFELIQKNLSSAQNEEEFSKISERIESIRPLHLAVTYLDGSKACCLVLHALLDDHALNFRASDTNNLGHTTFDCLMMTILRAHTSATPGDIDDGLRDEKSFPGEEVDICGRFDADSDNVRALVGAGRSGIPFSWKHKFCHTSIQAICHCIQAFARYSIQIEDIMITDVPSGLFVKRCVHCGLKMQLAPLHTLVLVGFQLGKSGARDEDLFGIIAILLCILRWDANTLAAVEVSMTALFPEEELRKNAELAECDHEPLRAWQVAEIARGYIENWSDKAKTGWAIMTHILRIAELALSKSGEPTYSRCGNTCECDYDSEYDSEYDCECDNEYDCKCDCYKCFPRYHGESNDDIRLATLHAAVQTELLTYRRLREEDPWVSPFFDMASVLRSLETGEPLSIDLIKKDMMQPFCRNGCFGSAASYWPRAEHVMKYHFSNLEDWSRTTFIPG